MSFESQTNFQAKSYMNHYHLDRQKNQAKSLCLSKMHYCYNTTEPAACKSIQNQRSWLGNEVGAEVYSVSSKISGCGWKSPTTTNPEMFQGFVHMNTLHPVTEGGKTGGHKMQDVFQNSLEKIDLPAGVDDANRLLHIVRFFPKPMKDGIPARKSPLSAEPMRDKDFTYFGKLYENDEALDAHANRGKILSVPMDNMHKVSNINTDGGLEVGVKYKTVNNAGQALLSINYWRILCNHFHPLDYRPEAIFQVALRKYCEGFMTKAQPFMRFWTIFPKRECSQSMPERKSFTL